MQARVTRWVSGRLSRQIMAALTISVFVVGVPSALLLHHLSERSAIEDAKRVIGALQDSKIREIEADLAQAETSLEKLSTFITREMAEPTSLEDDTNFALSFVPQPDGSIRSDPKHFDGRTQAGTYIDPNTPRTPFTRAFHARLAPVIELYGAAQLPRFDTLWLLTRWHSMIVMMPRVPRYVFDATPQDDYNKTEWITGADPAVNPDRRMYWTEPTYDPVSRSWMVSAVRPLDIAGEWVGTVGHDFFLAGLFERLSVNPAFAQAQDFLIDRHGDYMLAGQWQNHIESAAYAEIDKAEIDAALADVRVALEDGKTGHGRIVVTDFLGQPYLAVSNSIRGPDWRLIHLVPVASVAGRISQTFIGSAIITLIAFVIVALTIHMLLQRRVIGPLRALSASVQRFESGEFDSRAMVRSQDEIGSLAAAFNSMASRIGISQRKLEATQTELRNRNIELQRANRVKSNFLANMSHELRTPLNAILGFSEVLKLEIYGAIGDKRYLEYVGHIHRSGHHLLELISDVLDLSKIEAEKLELTFSFQDIRALIDDALNMVRPAANDRGVDLIAPPPGDATVLNCDRRAVSQMLINLVSNAVRHTPSGGSVAVEIDWRADDSLVIAVRDTGTGIPEQLLPHLFSPFGVRSAHIAGAGHSGGTGLGLSITQGLIRLHGGEIELDTKLGQGTCMRLVFPASRTKKAADLPATQVIAAAAAQ
ncbi:ATP-binding protein [Dongia sp.]|uniref:ATP-binding protein n=1 Tax=Dongia sp. TaxID=1977262 RepID=UPI0035AF5176